VINGNRTVWLWGLVALLALAPPAVAKPDAKPETKSDAKGDAKSEQKTEKKTEKKTTGTSGAKSDRKSADKTGDKSSETAASTSARKSSEKSADTPAKTSHANNSKSASASRSASAHDAGAGGPVPHSRPGVTAPSRALALPLGAPPRTDPGGPMLAYAPPAAADSLPLAAATTAATPPGDIDGVKQALGLVRAGKIEDATNAERGISDPLARKLVEWVILRNDDNQAGFARYNAFITANPSWPSMVTFRRRAEAMLWQERAPPATVRAYFADTKPLSAKGRFALARALLLDGDRAGAQFYAREAWRLDSFSEDVEGQALELFRDLLTRADDKARMDRRLYTNEDLDSVLRAARRLGGDEPAIAKARIAVLAKGSNAKTLLDAVPAAARHDAGYVFSNAQWLRQHDKIAEAGAVIQSAPHDPALLQDLDEWWVERRLIARKLLDIGDPKLAYAVVRDAAPPTKSNYRAEHQFTAGWIAFRFLNEPAIATQHFARVAQGNANPITVSRAGYWLGRTAEALSKPQEARSHYEMAARYSTAYYGQLARARLGHGELAFSAPPPLSSDRRQALSRLEVVRAAEILYALDERDLVAPLAADLADKTTDQGALAMLAELAEKNGDARSALLIGKMALGRGFPFDQYAFPVGGLPRYSAIGPQVEPAVVYSIARQESAFNPKTVSSAKALGLMQVTPDAGRYIAKKFGVPFDQHRLLHDTVYNMQMGAAELGDDIERYRGSYILAFAGYNAGAGRVKEWVERYGDPRDPRVDPIDWVERIPFSETRNYVERILENLQVYRVRFGGGSKLMIEADLHRGALTD
jgi:soluble lytic murein transglycosylase